MPPLTERQQTIMRAHDHLVKIGLKEGFTLDQLTEFVTSPKGPTSRTHDLYMEAERNVRKAAGECKKSG